MCPRGSFRRLKNSNLSKRATTLGKLNEKGQRINIRIDLDRKDRAGSVSFISGWMVQPNGTLKLNTPYGGK